MAFGNTVAYTAYAKLSHPPLYRPIKQEKAGKIESKAAREKSREREKAAQKQQQEKQQGKKLQVLYYKITCDRNSSVEDIGCLEEKAPCQPNHALKMFLH